jgi:hypothetical protein
LSSDALLLHKSRLKIEGLTCIPYPLQARSFPTFISFQLQTIMQRLCNAFEPPLSRLCNGSIRRGYIHIANLECGYFIIVSVLLFANIFSILAMSFNPNP